MIFNISEHRKMVRYMVDIFDYLYKNYVSKIRSKIEFNFKSEDKNYYFIIYPSQTDRCFKIKDSEDNLYIIYDTNIYQKSTADLFVHRDRNYQTIHDLFINDNLMFVFIKNWNLILEKCNQQIEEDNKNLELLNNFEIKN